MGNQFFGFISPRSLLISCMRLHSRTHFTSTCKRFMKFVDLKVAAKGGERISVRGLLVDSSKIEKLVRLHTGHSIPVGKTPDYLHIRPRKYKTAVASYTTVDRLLS